MDAVKFQIMMRVKLPCSSHYHSSPSGDTAFEIAYKEAIFSAKPRGYEVSWPRANEKWPVDSEGYTFVPLYLTDANDAAANWMEKFIAADRELERIRKKLRELV